MTISAAFNRSDTLRFLSPLLAISSGSCVVLSLDTIVAGWVALFWVVSAILTFISFYQGKSEVFSYSFRLLTVLLLVSVAVAAHWPQGWQYVLAQALVLMLGIKLMELRSQRDAFQFCGLGVLGLGVASLARFDLGFGFLIMTFFFLGLVLILWQHVFDHTGKISGLSSPGWMLSLKLVLFALFLTVMTIALGLLLFFIFPRNINPMLNLGAGMEIHRTGFSSEMSPGSVSEIVASNRVAFRALIDQNIESSNLYWRGVVLWETDGTVWKTGAPHEFQVRPVIPEGHTAGSIVQTITLNPGRTEYLFGLYFPGRVQDASPVYYNRDRSMKMDDIIETAMRYEVYSWQDDRLPLSFQEKSAGLQVPVGLDPGISELAQELAGDSRDSWSIAHDILLYFSRQGFEYSLTSPAGFEGGQTLADFLFETRTGYCELYAAAMTILLRMNSIPSRIVVGFWGGEYNPVGGYRVVRDSMAHAWVEAWFDDRGWILFDPTRELGASMSDRAGEDAAVQETGASAPDQVMNPAMRVVDWLRWQWTNAIIDMTLARQIRMWRSVRSGIQEAWSGLRTPDLSAFREALERHRAILIFTGLIVAAAGFMALKHLQSSMFMQEPGDKLRRKAWKRLARRTPGRHNLKKPGQEKSAWEWWDNNYPSRARKLKQVYNSQRYGPRPDAEGDKELKRLLWVK